MTSVQEAGAIVVRAGNFGPLVLLVTAKRNPESWIFPKGHVERGETLEEAAVREAEEEAGVSGVPIGRAGLVAFEFERVEYRVQYFVLATSDHGTPEEGRRLAWMSYDDALERLTFDTTRRVLRDARALVQTALRGRQ